MEKRKISESKNNARIKIFRSGQLICETTGVPGETLLAHISDKGAFIDAPCGGNGRCGKCLVRLSPGGEQVLACQTQVDGDMDVYLPGETEMDIADKGVIAYTPPDTKPPQDVKLGVAIDIGTTTVVAHLTDLVTGKRIATASGANVQRAYGADVISRIQYCSNNGHDRLTQLIREQLSTLIRRTCAVTGHRARDIGYVSIAANTIMEHLAAGYSPVGMGVAPFLPVDLFGVELPAWESLAASKSANVYYAPAISSYVGGDITAGMLAAGLEEADGPVIYLDIGTNGEIVMKYDDTYYCCAAAAGPAFEGAEITMGMAAVSGAINHVTWDDELTISVIGNGTPCGICGSGLLDALALLIRNGAVDETGRLLDADGINGEIARGIDKIEGNNVFWLTRDGGGVYISASDVRKLQLAKSAIAAGIQTLLSHVGITEEQVKLFVLAGGFGSFMNQYSAAQIGMFPTCFLPVTQTLGNTAGEGAALALLFESARAKLEDIRNRCVYIELSTNPVFRDQFVEQMTFDIT